MQVPFRISPVSLQSSNVVSGFKISADCVLISIISDFYEHYPKRSPNRDLNKRSSDYISTVLKSKFIIDSKSKNNRLLG